MNLSAPGPRSAMPACASSSSTLPPARTAGSTWCGMTRASAGTSALLREEDHEVWLLSWLPGQRTGFHRPWQLRGAFTVVQGCLRGAGRAGPARPEAAGATRCRDRSEIVRPAVRPSDVRNESARPSASAFTRTPRRSPPCDRFEVSGLSFGPRPRRETAGAVVRAGARQRPGAGPLDRRDVPRRPRASACTGSGLPGRSQAVRGGRCSVDIRPQAQRAAEARRTGGAARGAQRPGMAVRPRQ